MAQMHWPDQAIDQLASSSNLHQNRYSEIDLSFHQTNHGKQPKPVLSVFTIKAFSQLCVKQNILATLSYFDIFNYPLTQTEIAQFLKSTYSREELIAGINQLTEENRIYKFDEFYLLKDNYSLVQKRREANIRAKAMLKEAERIAGLLSGFPFVKGVAVRGLISNTIIDENSQIDFLIITEKNKLWLARSSMQCFIKLASAFGKQQRFCLNYFVDEEMLHIKEKNIYTATQTATLLPLRGIGIFNAFFKNNVWIKDFLPNQSLRIAYVQETKNPILKRVAEFIFRNPLGALLDQLLMHITVYRWSKRAKAGNPNKPGTIISMEASKHYARPHTAFQKKFMEAYEQKIFSWFCDYENRLKTVFE